MFCLFITHCFVCIVWTVFTQAKLGPPFKCPYSCRPSPWGLNKSKSSKLPIQKSSYIYILKCARTDQFSLNMNHCLIFKNNFLGSAQPASIYRKIVRQLGLEKIKNCRSCVDNNDARVAPHSTVQGYQP
jgi:hypothetical protein